MTGMIYRFKLIAVRGEQEILEALTGCNESGWELFQTVSAYVDGGRTLPDGITLFFRQPKIGPEVANGRAEHKAVAGRKR